MFQKTLKSSEIVNIFIYTITHQTLWEPFLNATDKHNIYLIKFYQTNLLFIFDKRGQLLQYGGLSLETFYGRFQVYYIIRVAKLKI